MSKSAKSILEQKMLLEEFSNEASGESESESVGESVPESAVIIEKPKKERKPYVMTPAREAVLKKAHDRLREKGQKTREDKLLPKPKRELTEAQKEVLKRGHEINLEIKKKKTEEKQLEEAERQKHFEELIVKKAIAIKKKQIKREAALEEISDDDTPVEKIKEISKKVAIKQGKTIEIPKPQKEPTFFEKYKFI